ncbi:MAG: hypothetical protein ACRDVZ_15700, partial [Jiangellaceae bacterium]
VVLLDTQVAGHWKRTITRDHVAVEVGLYAPFGDVETEALHVEIDVHCRFLGRAADVVTRLL